MAHSTSEFPPSLKGTPLLGHLLRMKKEGVYFYLNAHKEVGDAISLKAGPKQFYLFLHPEYYKEILIDKPDIFIKGKQYDSLRLVLGNGLLTSEGTSWQKQRKSLNSVFGKEGMDILLKHIESVTLDFVTNRIELNKEINFTKVMFDYTLSVAIKSFFGDDYNKIDLDKFTNECFKTIRFVSKRMSNVYSAPLYLPTKENREFKKSLAYLKDIVSKMFQSKISSQNKEAKDLIEQLIQAGFSEEEIWDQIISFLIAGHETTALTMSWMFHLLCQYSDYQSLIMEEAQSRNFEFENSLSLSNYPLINAIINETMRLYPAGWVIARDIAEDTTVGKYKVAKGNVIAISPLVTHRDERFFPSPNNFMPERFIEGNKHYHELTKNSYLPFSIGRRNCIGARFALLEMNLFILNFFKLYKIESDQKPLKMKGFVTLKPSENLRVKVSKI